MLLATCLYPCYNFPALFFRLSWICVYRGSRSRILWRSSLWASTFGNRADTRSSGFRFQRWIQPRKQISWILHIVSFALYNIANLRRLEHRRLLLSYLHQPRCDCSSSDWGSWTWRRCKLHPWQEQVGKCSSGTMNCRYLQQTTCSSKLLSPRV